MPPKTKLRKCDGKIVYVNLGGAFCLDGPRELPAMPAEEQATRDLERAAEREGKAQVADVRGEQQSSLASSPPRPELIQRVLVCTCCNIPGASSCPSRQRRGAIIVVELQSPLFLQPMSTQPVSAQQSAHNNHHTVAAGWPQSPAHPFRWPTPFRDLVRGGKVTL